ncbi:hypothetical protein Clacol_009601 [Clathrus columnatus]|uniref:Uncharacterized protein n=1 Tax=Clathrus columnatus TaxID=1419009 RepID=A0AAV5ATU9_9AGAM|nr:hypothetical protein Clacol_009601 [Clathrus columnatus]
MPLPESMSPDVPPKDPNMILNPPMETSRPGSMDIGIASIELPQRSQGNHRRQTSSWILSPLDPDIKARAAAAARMLQIPSEVPKSNDTFQGMHSGQLPRLPEAESTPKFSLNDYVSSLSLSSPQWVKQMRPAKRGSLLRLKEETDALDRLGIEPVLFPALAEGATIAPPPG